MSFFGQFNRLRLLKKLQSITIDDYDDPMFAPNHHIGSYAKLLGIQLKSQSKLRQYIWRIATSSLNAYAC